MASSIRARIAEFIAETDYSNLPKEVVHQTKRCLLDFLGVALASGTTDLISNVSGMARQMGGAQEATVIGENYKLPLPNAVLVNGIKSHTLDMDDGNRFGNVHPAVTVIPATLALAEHSGTKGKDLLAALVTGYETLIYIAKAVNPAHLEKGFHTTANLGAFGAAAACSKIMALDKEKAQNALSIAGLCGGGLLEVLSSGQMMKPFQTTRASQAGLFAAQLAQRGARGPELIFEGEKGFFQAYAGKEILMKDFERLGTYFETMNIYFKMFSACRHIHPALDAVIEILNREKLKIDEITGIEVDTYSIAYSLTGHRTEERSVPAAKFSMPVSMALMLVYGKLDSAVFTEQNISNPVVQSLADKVAIRVETERDLLYPKQRGARVAIKTDEKRYVHEVTVPKGEPENPLSDQELIDKFEENARLLYPMNKVRSVCEKIFNLQDINTDDLMRNLADSEKR